MKELEWIGSSKKDLLQFPLIVYCYRPQTLIIDSSRQSPIKASRSERGSPSPRGKGDEEDRFGKVAASPNSHNLSGCRIEGLDVPSGLDGSFINALEGRGYARFLCSITLCSSV